MTSAQVVGLNESAAPVVLAMRDETQPIINTNQEIASLNLDGSNATDDSVIIEEHNCELTTIKILLGTGRVIEKNFIGNFEPQLYASDIDKDSVHELVLFLGEYGSTYGSGTPYIFKICNGKLKLLPSPLDIDYSALNSSYYRIDKFNCNGIKVLKNGVLRLEGDSNAGPDYFSKVFYENDSWIILENGLLFSREEEFVPDFSSILLDQEIIHGKDYCIPKVKFISEEVDPDAAGFDETRGLPSISARQAVVVSARTLYNLTGYVMSEVSVRFEVSRPQNSDFSFIEPGKESGDEFFHIQMDTCTGQIRGLSLNYDTSVGLTREKILKPVNFEQLTLADIAKHYLQESTMFDETHLNIVDFRSNELDEVIFFLNSGEFFEVRLEVDTKLPISIYGPYPKGYTH